MAPRLENCGEHTKSCERLTSLESSREHVGRQVSDQAVMINKLTGDLAELRGKVERDYPQFRENIGKIFKMIEDKIKTDEMYQSEFRQLVHDVETLTKASAASVDKESHDKTISNLATKESVENLKFRLNIGWVSLTGTGLLIVIGVALKLLGWA
jgi:cysteinyl-tRNA synthetase